MSERSEYIELDQNKLPSILELCFKHMGGRNDSERTVVVTSKDGKQHDFVIGADLDYTGWADEGVPLDKKGQVKLKVLPDNILYDGTVSGLEAELGIFPEDDQPAEYYLGIERKT